MKKQVPENPVKNRTDGFNCLVVVAALTVTCYLTANLMAVKLIEIFGLAWFDAGTITFPLAYMLGDVLTEVWGFKTARKVIFLTFVCNILLVAATSIGLILPSPDYMAETNAAYAAIFTVTPRILGASLVAFLAGELSNSWVLTLIKKRTNGKFLWLRTIGSSAVGYIFDTVVFVLLAFAGTVPTADLIAMIVAQYIAKLVIEAIGATPLAYGAVAYIRKKEGITADGTE